MLDTSNLSSFLKGITDVIRRKKGTSEPIKHSLIDEEIESIETEDTGVGSRQWWLDVFKEKTDCKSLFRNCTTITEIPLIDTSYSTEFGMMFGRCTSLITIPLINTSRGTDFNTMFIGCTSLTEIPLIDTHRGTNFKYMFAECAALTTIPQIDIAVSVDCSNMFKDCSSLLSLPELDTSNSEDLSYMFRNCKLLTEISITDTGRAINLNYMFYGCAALQTLTNPLGLDNATYNMSMFHGCTNLTNISFYEGTIMLSIAFYQSTLLSDESIQSIIDGLCDNTGNDTILKLTFPTNIVEKLTEEQLSQISNKNWQVG